MDETPEELEQIRQEADGIDPHSYRRKFRFLAAIGLGALGAGIVAVVLYAVDQKRNPCARVETALCGKDPTSLACASYHQIRQDSETDPSREMRRNLRAQCDTKIRRLAQEDGIQVP